MTRTETACPRVRSAVYRLWTARCSWTSLRHGRRDYRGELVSGETAHWVHFVLEHTGLHAGVVVHDARDVFLGGVEDPDAAPRAVVEDGAHDREDAVGAQREVASAVLPDDLVAIGRGPNWVPA